MGTFQFWQEHIDHLINNIQPWLEHYGYWGLFLAVGLENVFIPLPGQSLLIVSSILAARGNLSIAWVLLGAYCASVIGATLGYWLGRFGGSKLLNKLPLSKHRLEKARGTFKRHGTWLLLVGRFIEGLRQLQALLAGTLNMPFKRYMLVNLAGSAIWVLVWGLGSFTLTHQIHPVLEYLHTWRALALALTALALIALGLYLFHRDKAAPPKI